MPSASRRGNLSCWCIGLDPALPTCFPPRMAHTLYVGNLPFKISDEELAVHFASAGEVVEVTHVRERGSDRSNGCGFIEMADATGAEQAVSRWMARNWPAARSPWVWPGPKEISRIHDPFGI